MSANANRDARVEILRVLASCGVIVLHINNPLYGRALTLSVGANHVALSLLQGMSICAVDLFMLLSGFFLVSSPRRNAWKAVSLIAEVIAIRLIMSLAKFSMGRIGIRAVLGSLLPVSYFAILYSAVYLLSPWVNLVFHERRKKELDIMLAMFVGLLSIWPTLVDLLTGLTGVDLGDMSTVSRNGSLSGYTLTNFMLMYCVGAWMRLREEAVSRLKCPWLGFIVCAVVVAALRLIGEYVGNPGILSATSYCAPWVVASAVFSLACARKKRQFESHVVTRLAKASFTVYLVNIPLVSRLPIESIVSLPLLLMLLAIAALVAAVYLVALAVDFAWEPARNRLATCRFGPGGGQFKVRGGCGSVVASEIPEA